MRLPTSDEVRRDIRHALDHLWDTPAAILQSRTRGTLFAGWGCLGFCLMAMFWMVVLTWWALKLELAFVVVCYKLLYIVTLLLVLGALLGGERFAARRRAGDDVAGTGTTTAAP